MSRSLRLRNTLAWTGGIGLVALVAGITPAGPGAPAALARPAAAQPAAAGLAARARSPQGVAAYAAELADVATGRQLWGRRQYAPRPIASIAKVLTALVVIEHGHLGRRITITQADEAYLGCCIQGAGLIPGDVLTARQLLYAMLLPSGADAAMALATSYGPGAGRFIARMNATARRLRLVGTRFTSFDGVDPGTVSTPRNLLLLGEAAMRLRAFREVVASRTFRIRAGPHHHRYFWQNTNLLLGHYPGLIGIKTGWTPEAGECLLFEAIRAGRPLIGVVLDSAPTKTGQIFVDATRMLDWGFRLRNPVPPPRLPATIPAE